MTVIERDMNKIIEQHLSEDKKLFFTTGVLAEVVGRMHGNVTTMRDESLDSLSKDYYADKFEELTDILEDLREYLFDLNQHYVKTNI